jgi:hypothetical protein
LLDRYLERLGVPYEREAVAAASASSATGRSSGRSRPGSPRRSDARRIDAEPGRLEE